MPGPDHAILYDGDCGFCTRMLGRVLRWDRRDRLRAVSIQSDEGQRLLEPIPPGERLDSWHLVGPEGTIHSAGAAGPVLLRLLPGGRAPAAVLAAFPRATEAVYRRIAANRELLGRFLALALVVTLVGCGSTVQEESSLSVYLSAPLAGKQGERGRALAAGAQAALEDAGGEVAGAAVELEILDSAAERPPDEGGPTPTQASIAANAREASRDSVAIAYIGEAGRGTMISAPITNEAGILQLSPGPVPRPLLAEPGGTDVPVSIQPSGERTLGALVPEGAELDPGEVEVLGREAMALVLDSIARAEDPLSRASVLEAFFATSGRDSPLGAYTIDPVGRAAYSGDGPGA